MAKTKIQEYDATAANNTDIDSVDISEGCAPAGINNAIRELMAHFKTALSGSDDSVVTGTAGTADNLAKWNADGDLVDASVALSGSDATVVTGTAGSSGELAEWDANGDIVGQASPTVTDITVAGNIIHDGDTDNRFTFTTDQQVFDTGGVERFRINNNGIRVGAAGGTIDEFETTITDDDTKAPTSGAVVDYVAANGGGLVFISSTDASASANVSFTGFDATSYDYYEFVLGNLVPATDAVDLWLRTSTDGGSTYDSGAGAYEYAVNQVESNGTVQRTASTGDTKLIISGGEQVGSDTGEDGVSGVVRVYHPHLTKRTIITWELTYFNDVGLLSRVTGGGVRDSAADVDAVRFLFSSGNIESGSISMYARVNA